MTETIDPVTLHEIDILLDKLDHLVPEVEEQRGVYLCYEEHLGTICVDGHFTPVQFLDLICEMHRDGFFNGKLKE